MSLEKHTVFVWTSDNDSFKEFANRLRLLVEQSLVEECVLIEASSEVSIRQEVIVIGDQGLRTSTLDEHVASLDGLTNLNIVGVVTDFSESSAVSEVSSSIASLASQFRMVVNQRTSVNEIRAYAPCFEKLDHLKIAFDIGSSNWIIVPEDRSTPDASALPVVASSPTFLDHLVVELCSLLGLWRGLPFDPRLVNHVVVAGRSTPQVRFSRSFVRIVRGEFPGVSASLSDEELLPSTSGFDSYPDPEWATRELAGRIFPEEFTFSLPTKEDNRLRLKKAELIKHFLKEVGQTVVRLPRFYAQGIAADLEVGAAKAVEGIYGNSSWVSLEKSDRKTAESDETSEFSALKNRLMAQTERPNLDDVPSSVWHRLVDQILGVIDGGDSADVLRRDIGSTQYLLLDRRFISEKPSDSIEEFAALHQWIISPSEGLSDTNEPPLLSESETKSLVSIDGTHDTESGSDVPSTVPNRRAVTAPDTTLLGRLGSRFRSESQAAENALNSALDKIRNYEMRKSEVSQEVSKAVVVVFVASLTVLFILRLSFTSWHSALSFDSFEAIDRARLWVLLTLVVLFSAAMNLTPSGGKRAQTYFVVTTIAFSASVAASLLYFDPIYRGVRRILSWSGEGPIVAITAVAVLLVTRSFVRRSHGDFPARKLRRQIMFSILYLYLLTGVLVGLSREDSFLQTMSSQSRTRLALFLGFVSAVSLIASLIVVALIRVRERNRFSSWEMELRWNLLLAEHTARELKVLKLREVQWLGTSLALSKLIWSPLGSNAQKGPALAPPEFTSSLKKFQIAKLEINAEGLHFLSARTRRVFANRGWLHGQYERAVKSFALRYARRMGTDSSDVLVGRPESCSFPETLENLSRGELTSRRWEFARSLISGEHDMTLQNDGVSQVAHSAFREVLEKPELHSFHCGDHGSVKEFILQLDDSHMGQGELPAKIVSLAPLSFSGANAKPECYWWFPKDDFECSNLAAVNSSIPIEFSRAVIMSGKLEVSAPVLLSDLVQIASSSNDEDLYEQGDGL